MAEVGLENRSSHSISHRFFSVHHPQNQQRESNRHCEGPLSTLPPPPLTQTRYLENRAGSFLCPPGTRTSMSSTCLNPPFPARSSCFSNLTYQGLSVFYPQTRSTVLWEKKGLCSLWSDLGFRTSPPRATLTTRKWC